LHQIGFLDLLPEFYTRTIIPSAVADELERGRSMGIDLPDVGALSWIAIQSPEGLDKVPTAPDLDADEPEVLALAMQVPGPLVIMDERIGRLYAAALKLTFTGTLGILLRAKAEGRIPRIEPLLEHLASLGFRLRRERTRPSSSRLAKAPHDGPPSPSRMGSGRWSSAPTLPGV
jgi:predicted nucleic acid-binding protein